MLNRFIFDVGLAQPARIITDASNSMCNIFIKHVKWSNIEVAKLV